MAIGQIQEVLHHLRGVLRVPDDGRLPDGELLERFITRQDECAFGALLRRHGPMVLGVCRRVLGNIHDAEDAFQATFLVLVRKASSIVPRQQLAGWLHGVAWRTALKARTALCRRRRRERQALRPEAPEPEADLVELLPWLDRELSRLPEKYRLPVVLCELEGRSRKEVARLLGLPEGTLSSRLAEARKRLAARLARTREGLSAGALGILLQQQAEAGVPAAMLGSTTQAAGLAAAGGAALGLLSPQVAALTKGVIHAMFLIKLKLTLALCLALGILSGGLLVLAGPTEAGHRARKQEPAKTTPQKDAGKDEKPPAPPPKPLLGIDRLEQLAADLVKQKKTDEQICEVLFLATLSRFPSADEVKRLKPHMAKAPNRAEAAKDLFWALINSTEFQLHTKAIEDKLAFPKPPKP
jgi:RNA polymerase sigma factor (sigma-70 family)